MPIETPSEVYTWFLAAAAGLTAVGAVAAWMIVHRARRIEERLARLDRLDELAAGVKTLAAREGELDLRRLEHVLIDIRDGQRRVEDRMLALLEARAGHVVEGRSSSLGDEAAAGGALVPASASAEAGAALSDRIVTRLLALGYERIVLVTPTDEIARVAREGGAVVVESRRDGAACKGRVIVADGRIHDLQIQSAYSTFP